MPQNLSNMKTIIINKRHMNYLNEVNAVNVAAQAKDNSLSSFTTAASDTNTVSDIQKAKIAGDVNLVVTGPKSDDTQPKQVVNVANGDTVQNALADQASDEIIRNGGSVVLSGDGIGESLVFSKKKLEEIRLNRIKKNGIVMSKKELTEKWQKYLRKEKKL